MQRLKNILVLILFAVLLAPCAQAFRLHLPMSGTPCPEQTDLPAENRVGEFFDDTEESAPELQPQVAVLHHVARPILIQTVSGRCILFFVDPYGLCAESYGRSELPWYEKMFNAVDDWLYEKEQWRDANRANGDALAYDYMNNPEYAEARSWHEGLGSVADKVAVGAAIYGGYQSINNLTAASTAPKTTTSVKWPSNRGFMPGEGKPSSVLPGNLVDRYGGTGGSFLSPQGTPAAARSLAPGTTSRPLNTYKVMKPFEANAGRAAPWFNQPGKGIQYDLGTKTVQDLINSGHLLPQ